MMTMFECSSAGTADATCARTFLGETSLIWFVMGYWVDCVRVFAKIRWPVPPAVPRRDREDIQPDRPNSSRLRADEKEIRHGEPRARRDWPARAGPRLASTPDRAFRLGEDPSASLDNAAKCPDEACRPDPGPNGNVSLPKRLRFQHSQGQAFRAGVNAIRPTVIAPRDRRIEPSSVRGLRQRACGQTPP